MLVEIMFADDNKDIMQAVSAEAWEMGAVSLRLLSNQKQLVVDFCRQLDAKEFTLLMAETYPMVNFKTNLY